MTSSPTEALFASTKCSVDSFVSVFVSVSTIFFSKVGASALTLTDAFGFVVVNAQAAVISCPPLVAFALPETK